MGYSYIRFSISLLVTHTRRSKTIFSSAIYSSGGLILPGSVPSLSDFRVLIFSFGLLKSCVMSIYVTGFARRGLIRAPLQHTDFTTIL